VRRRHPRTGEHQRHPPLQRGLVAADDDLVAVTGGPLARPRGQERVGDQQQRVGTRLVDRRHGRLRASVPPVRRRDRVASGRRFRGSVRLVGGRRLGHRGMRAVAVGGELRELASSARTAAARSPDSCEHMSLRRHTYEEER
jgi:hypothetical protein